MAQYDIVSSVRFPDDYTRAGLPCLRDANLNEIYNLFDVMVLPTIGEGFGLPMLESMAAGTPVIATNFTRAASSTWAGQKSKFLSVISYQYQLSVISSVVTLGGMKTGEHLPREWLKFKTRTPGVHPDVAQANYL
jgi:glycosyltransferase involved in cell wall biosynthesis